MQPLRRGAAGAFLNTAATRSAMTLATLYLQDTMRHSPQQAAAMLVPFSLAVVASSVLAAPVLRRIGPQPTMATGLAVIAAADAALTAAAAGAWVLPACVATAGVGLGLSSVAATALGAAVPATLRGTASGIINTAAQLGTATGIAAILLVEAVTTGPPEPGTAPPAIAWAAAAAIAAAGALAFGIRPPSLREKLTPSIRHPPGRSRGRESAAANQPGRTPFTRLCTATTASAPAPEDRASRRVLVQWASSARSLRGAHSGWAGPGGGAVACRQD